MTPGPQRWRVKFAIARVLFERGLRAEDVADAGAPRPVRSVGKGAPLHDVARDREPLRDWAR